MAAPIDRSDMLSSAWPDKQSAQGKNLGKTSKHRHTVYVPGPLRVSDEYEGSRHGGENLSLARSSEGTSVLEDLRSLLSRMIPCKWDSVRHHRRTRSENTEAVLSTTPFETRLISRRRRSEDILSSKGQITSSSGNDRNSRQLTRLNQVGHRARSPPFDPSRLEDRLTVALQDSRSTRRQFLPSSKLDSLITQDTVDRQLAQVEYLSTRIIQRTWEPSTRVFIRPSPDHYGVIATADGVTSSAPDIISYQKIFAILLYMNREKEIWSFVRERVSDLDLPLVKVHHTGLVQLRRRGHGQPSLACLTQARDIGNFVALQWCFLAPVLGSPLGERLLHCNEFNDQIILPFVSWKYKGHGGGFAQVYKAKIHSDHHAFSTSDVHEGIVAVKKLAITHRSAFDRESNVLQNLRKERHAHENLITLLTAYEHNDHLHLVFPWAKLDLAQYWRHRAKPPGPDCGLPTWIREQCCGIAEAIGKIHRYPTLSGSTMLCDMGVFVPGTDRHPKHDVSDSRNQRMLYGRHGDIKPANILWFPNAGFPHGHGILKISDFGTARFSTDDTISGERKDDMPFSRSYQSPESQLPGGQLSSQCDVWALGCVFLEFVCWYFGGQEELDRFEQARVSVDKTPSFSTFRRGETSNAILAELKEPVAKMILTLRQRVASLQANVATLQDKSTSSRDLLCILEAVERDMLLVMDNSNCFQQQRHACEAFVPNGPLQVSQPPMRRRRSVSNIARDLGPVLE